MKALEDEMVQLKKTASFQNDELSSSSQRLQGLVEVSVKSNLINNLKKTVSDRATRNHKQFQANVMDFKPEVAENNVQTEQPMKLAPQPPKAAPPPPPLPLKGSRAASAKVVRVPEVVEFYHSLMRRESHSRRDSNSVVAEVPATANARDMIGEIENRSSHLLAVSVCLGFAEIAILPLSFYVSVKC